MTKCLKIGCSHEATQGFEACTALHGSDLRFYRTEIPRNFSAEYASKIWGGRESFTIEEALVYLN